MRGCTKHQDAFRETLCLGLSEDPARRYRLPLSVPVGLTWVCKKRQVGVLRPHGPGARISALGGHCQFKFWIWVVQNSCLPPPDLPLSGRGSCWGGNPPLPAQAGGWGSGPLTCWTGGLSLGFFQDRGSAPLRKDSLCLSCVPLGKRGGKRKKQMQPDFCSLIFYSILYIRSRTSTLKKNTIQFRKSKNVFDSSLLLDIISYFKSGNATSASALKDSPFISSPKVGGAVLAKISDT